MNKGNWYSVLSTQYSQSIVTARGLFGALVLIAAVLPTIGCGVASRSVPQREQYTWDVSTDRDSTKFPWFDFDPDFGAIDQPATIALRFDEHREFRGDVELITFSRADSTARNLQSISVNLPAQTAHDAKTTLRTLAESWNLSTVRVDRDSKDILDGSHYRGIILAERDTPTIHVEVWGSFNDAKPYFLSISWFWKDDER